MRSGHFVFRKTRAAAPAPWHRQPLLIQPAAPVAFLQEKPDPQNVGILVGEVGVVPIHPHAQPDGLVRDYSCIGLYALTALPRKVGQAEPFYIGLSVESERPLHFHFYPQPLAIETVLVFCRMPRHRLIAEKDVLQSASPSVMDAHGIIGGDRPVKKPE